MNTNEENKVIVKPDEQKQVCSSPDTEKKETPKENRPREIKAKISIEIIEKGEPTIGERICQFFAAVCLLSTVVFVISTFLIFLAKDPGETLSGIQIISAFAGVSSFWLFIICSAWDDGLPPIGGSGGYL